MRRASRLSSEVTEPRSRKGWGAAPVIQLLRSAVGRLSKRKRLLAVGLGLIVLACSGLALGHKLGERCGGWSGRDANGLPLGSVTVRDLETHPEFALYYPGASVIDHGGIDEQDSFLGRPGSAYTTSVLERLTVQIASMPGIKPGLPRTAGRLPRCCRAPQNSPSRDGSVGPGRSCSCQFWTRSAGKLPSRTPFHQAKRSSGPGTAFTRSVDSRSARRRR